jgi:uncharacterized protein (TIGR03437 family)
MDISGASRAALFHAEDSMLVTPDYPADRDEHLILYATGLGPASPQVSAGQPASEDPQSLNTLPVQVFIGGHSYKVISSRLAPGLVGVSEIRLYVPGDRVRGTDLPVVITVGGASSPSFQAPLAAIR